MAACAHDNMIDLIEFGVIQNGLCGIHRLDHMEADHLLRKIEVARPFFQSNQPLQINIAPALIECLVQFHQRGFQNRQTDQPRLLIGGQETGHHFANRHCHGLRLLIGKIECCHDNGSAVQAVHDPDTRCWHLVMTLPPAFHTFYKAWRFDAFGPFGQHHLIGVPQSMRQLSGCLIAIIRINGEAFQNNFLQPRRDPV